MTTTLGEYTEPIDLVPTNKVTGHAAAAAELLNAAETADSDASPADVRLMLEFAQTHATLALVHEQRTANLIAWHLHLDAQGDLTNEVMDTARDIEHGLRIPDGGARA